jgi:hypothetical protein
MSPTQEHIFEAALRTAAAVRQTARERALIDFVPTDPVNFPLYVAAVQAADAVFKTTVLAAAADAGIALPGSPP